MTMTDVEKRKAAIRTAIFVDPNRTAGNLAAEYGTSTRTVLKLQVEYWKRRAELAEPKGERL